MNQRATTGRHRATKHVLTFAPLIGAALLTATTFASIATLVGAYTNRSTERTELDPTVDKTTVVGPPPSRGAGHTGAPAARTSVDAVSAARPVNAPEDTAPRHAAPEPDEPEPAVRRVTLPIAATNGAVRVRVATPVAVVSRSRPVGSPAATPAPPAPAPRAVTRTSRFTTVHSSVDRSRTSRHTSSTSITVVSRTTENFDATTR